MGHVRLDQPIHVTRLFLVIESKSDQSHAVVGYLLSSYEHSTSTLSSQSSAVLDIGAPVAQSAARYHQDGACAA
jgi:hypothetical protein